MLVQQLDSLVTFKVCTCMSNKVCEVQWCCMHDRLPLVDVNCLASMYNICVQSVYHNTLVVAVVFAVYSYM